MNQFFIVQSWLDGNPPSAIKLPKAIRSYLLEAANYSCCKCGFDTPHPDDGATILEINHIDGDGT
ncbi:MAG: hypothetical protein ACWGQW_11825 [bacterium]